MIDGFDLVLRLIVASILGAIIGYERQERHKFAGLRTHLLVSLGSCLIMILSYNIYRSVQGFTNADPARLAAQVVSGVGFLGAGSIMIRKGIISGLTTAANLWVVAGVGLAVGFGSFLSAATTTVISYVALELLYRLEVSLKQSSKLVIVAINQPGQISKIDAYFGKTQINIYDIMIKNEGRETNQLEIKVDLGLPPKINSREVMSNLINIEGVIAVRNG